VLQKEIAASGYEEQLLQRLIGTAGSEMSLSAREIADGQALLTQSREALGSEP
jgi:hypothetical protein